MSLAVPGLAGWERSGTRVAGVGDGPVEAVLGRRLAEGLGGRIDRTDAGAEARGPGVSSPRERAPVAVRPGAFDEGLSSRCVPSLRAGAVDVVSDGAGGALCGFGGVDGV